MRHLAAPRQCFRRFVSIFWYVLLVLASRLDDTIIQTLPSSIFDATRYDYAIAYRLSSARTLSSTLPDPAFSALCCARHEIIKYAVDLRLPLLFTDEEIDLMADIVLECPWWRRRTYITPSLTELAGARSDTGLYISAHHERSSLTLALIQVCL